MTELKKVTVDIYNEFAKNRTFEESVMCKQISNEEMKNKLLQLGWTKERCLREEHYDVDENWIEEIFK